MTTEIPNVTITSGSTVLTGSIATPRTLEIDGSINIPATLNGTNTQRLNDRVFIGAATASGATPTSASWLDAIFGGGPSNAQLYVLSQSWNTAVQAGVQSLNPGGQFSPDIYAEALFGINNDNYTPSAVQWAQARLNGFDGLHAIVLNNGNLYTLAASGNSWSSPSGPSIVYSYVGDGSAAWAHTNAITWQPSTNIGPHGTAPGSAVRDGNTVWTPAVPAAWQPSYAYAQFSVVTNGGNHYVCRSAGTSAPSGGPTGTGTSINDGSAVWTYEAPAAWQQSHAYNLYDLAYNATQANYYVCVLAGTSNTAVVSNAGHYYVCTQGGTTAASGGPTGTGSSIADGTVLWSYRSSMSAATTWAKSHAYALYAPVVNGTSQYVCIHAGTSAGPAGPTGTGSNIADGSVKWSFQTSAPWHSSHAYAVNDVIANGGNHYVCTTAGTSAASGGPTGTGTSIPDGTVVWAYIAAWQPSQTYAVSDAVTNEGTCYVCTTAGVSAGPLGPSGIGSGITDGNAVWNYLRANSIPPVWQNSHAYNLNDVVYSSWSGGTTYICVQAGTSSATGPSPSGIYVWNDGGVKWMHGQPSPANSVTTLFVESRHYPNNLNQYTINSEMDIVVLSQAWQPTHAYNLNDTVVNGGNTYLCIAAGTSAASGGPTGGVSPIGDGTVVWQYYAGPDVTPWQPSQAYVLNSQVHNGTNVYRCIGGGMSAASGGPTGTGSSIADGTVTWCWEAAPSITGYLDPCYMYEALKTVGLWLSCGDPGVVSADATVALGIVGNGARFSKGIVIDANAIAGTTAFNPGASCAVALGSGHHIQWFAPVQDAGHGSWQPNTAYAVGYYAYNSGFTYACTQAGTSAASGGPSGTGAYITDGTAVWEFHQNGAVGGQVVAAIACNATAANQPSLGFTDGYAAFTEGDGGAWLFDIVGVANPVAHIEATAAASGGTPSLAAATWAGTESVDLALKAQQGGYLQLFTPSASATDAAGFSATHRLAVKDADGKVYYIACSSTAW